MLDYMYGVTAYRRWGSGQGIKEVMKQYFVEHYKYHKPLRTRVIAIVFQDLPVMIPVMAIIDREGEREIKMVRWNASCDG